MTRIKICGLTTVEAVQHCADVGVDAIGLVFYERSVRYVHPKAAQTLIDALPPFVTTVGLFMDAKTSTVRDVLNQVKLDSLQFHGAESSAYCEQFNKPYLKAIPMLSVASVAYYMNNYASAQGFLLDTMATGEAGGSGEAFDWSVIPEALPRPFILAGGLNPQNVANAIESTACYGVDVSSGVERIKGQKDPMLISEFVKQVRQTEPDLCL